MSDLTNGEEPLLLPNGIAVHGTVDLDAKSLTPYKRFFNGLFNSEPAVETHFFGTDKQKDYLIQALKQHCIFRAKHNAPILEHNPELSRDALKWAQNLASRRVLQNSDDELNGEPIGQNIGMFSKIIVQDGNVGWWWFFSLKLVYFF